ncbi:MAG TPA: CpaF family protein [Blastocatellia bacterium]|nr:CpaF family protein [Blastocatellia bacterium]HMX24549.1 CpaF family protein [Blastocatellia bacterium]HMY71424.1 CpaF family protein [Blastocatellia bacterium]HMZ17183.1 CpaF family protein [Blastocatellia bacterium]HNG31876.1 CpaF family protein [Blastocatellia bacterium]
MSVIKSRLQEQVNGVLPRAAGPESNAMQELKMRVHRTLINRLDLTKLEGLDQNVVQAEVKKAIQRILDDENAPLSGPEREKVHADVMHELFGLGPLEPLLADKAIADILVNGCKNIFIERHGKLEKVDIAFRDDAHLMQIIDRIVSRIGRRVDESSPMVDARLKDGSRVNAIIPPLALDGPMLSIRRFGADPLKIKDLINFQALTQELAQLLEACVKSRLNILISGGTGAGKTTMLNCLSSFIPNEERLVTIEDSAELILQQEHVVRLETRPPNIEGRGEITQRSLLKNSLRMRPDRIIVGEVRGEEAIDMLQAMNTGHDGGMTTIHANTPRDALSRLETMIAMANLRISDKAMRQQISSAINLIIQVSRMGDGSRKVMSVSEIIGMEGDIITMQEIFKFVRTGVDEKRGGKVLGQFQPTGIRPRFSERLEQYGFALPPNLFEPRQIPVEVNQVGWRARQ